MLSLLRLEDYFGFWNAIDFNVLVIRLVRERGINFFLYISDSKDRKKTAISLNDQWM